MITIAELNATLPSAAELRALGGECYGQDCQRSLWRFGDSFADDADEEHLQENGTHAADYWHGDVSGWGGTPEDSLQ